MAFSVTKNSPLRGLGLHRGSGKHAAPRGVTPESRRPAGQEPKEAKPYKAMHAASAPRLSGSSDASDASDPKAA
jgi:hypothetical protein